MRFVSMKVDDHVLQEWFIYAGFKARDAREPLREVAYFVIRPGIEEQFLTEGMRTGGWAELNEDYALRKFAEFGPKPILQRTGAMKMAMEAFDAYKVHMTSLTYQPKVPDYTHWHQTGGSTPGRPPQRQMVVITPEDEHQIEELFTLWLDDLRFSNARRPNSLGSFGGLPSIEVLE